jgi:hypothetical protein
MYLKSPESIKAAFDAGDPKLAFIKRYLDTWYAGEAMIPQFASYMWAMTGLEEYRIKAEAFEIPFNDAGHYRQEGLDALLHVKFMSPHVSQATRDRWEAGIKKMCTSAIHSIRSWDADERDCTIPILATCDAWYGTAYLTASEKEDTASPYYTWMDTVPQLLDMWNQALVDRVDGATSESIGYMINTTNKMLIGVMLIGKDFLPGLREWLAKFRTFLLWGISKDLKHSLVYGDQQESGDDWYALFLYYRQPLYLTMAAIDEDPDGQLRALSKKLTEVHNFFYPLYWHWALALDFTATDVPLALENGFKHFKPGVSIYRDDGLYFYATTLHPLHDDHDFNASGGMTHRLYMTEGGKVIDKPGSYGGTWTEENGSAIKGYAKFPDRGTEVAELLADGRVHVKGFQRGPVPAMVWPPGALDYDGHWFTAELYFDPALRTLDVAYEWNHDGVFPDPSLSQYYPQLQWAKPFETGFFVAPNADTGEVEDGLRYVSSGNREVFVSATGADLEVTREPWLFRNVRLFDWIRLKSDRHQGTHAVNYSIGATVEPPPPPPPPPPGVFDEPVPDDQLPAPAAVIVVDNLSLGYDAVGPWIRFLGQGIDGVDYVAAGDGTAKARFRAKVSPGTYNVATLWLPMDNRATDSRFAIKRGDGSVLAEVRVNQELPPSSFEADGQWWHTLADVTVTSDDILAVELTNDANDYVIADAVRFERIEEVEPPPPPPPTELTLPMVFDGGKYRVDRNTNGVVCLQVGELFERE